MLTPQQKDALLKAKAIYDSSPLLRDMHELQKRINERKISSRNSLPEIQKFIERLEPEHGLKFKYVPEGEIKLKGDFRDHSTINHTPGYLAVEEHYQTQPHLMIDELMHGLGHYLVVQKHGPKTPQVEIEVEEAGRRKVKSLNITHLLDRKEWEHHASELHGT